MWRGFARSNISLSAPFLWLIEPDRRLSRIRLPDKTSRIRPRHVAPERGQAYKLEVPAEVREWISPARVREYFQRIGKIYALGPMFSRLNWPLPGAASLILPALNMGYDPA